MEDGCRQNITGLARRYAVTQLGGVRPVTIKKKEWMNEWIINKSWMTCSRKYCNKQYQCRHHSRQFYATDLIFMLHNNHGMSLQRPFKNVLQVSVVNWAKKSLQSVANFILEGCKKILSVFLTLREVKSIVQEQRVRLFWSLLLKIWFSNDLFQFYCYDILNTVISWTFVLKLLMHFNLLGQVTFVKENLISICFFFFK